MHTHKKIHGHILFHHGAAVIISILSLICIYLPTIVESVDIATDSSSSSSTSTKQHSKCKNTVQYEVVGTIPSDENAFTQGLTYGNGKLYLSTGINGHSTVREISKMDGQTTLDNIDLADEYFGEGLAFYKNKLIQLTWKKRTGFIYETEPKLALIKTFTFETTRNEGWGITYDESKKQFIVSDGSEYLHFWDEDTLQETHKVAVLDTMGKVRNLNELEYYDEDRIMANKWYTDLIYIINIKSGQVEEIIDFSTLWPRSERGDGADVFNGISVYDNGEFLVTGKLWPLMYRIKFI